MQMRFYTRTCRCLPRVFFVEELSCGGAIVGCAPCDTLPAVNLNIDGTKSDQNVRGQVNHLHDLSPTIPPLFVFITHNAFAVPSSRAAPRLSCPTPLDPTSASSSLPEVPQPTPRVQVPSPPPHRKRRSLCKCSGSGLRGLGRPGGQDTGGDVHSRCSALAAADVFLCLQGGWFEFERCLATPDVMPIIR